MTVPTSAALVSPEHAYRDTRPARRLPGGPVLLPCRPTLPTQRRSLLRGGVVVRLAKIRVRNDRACHRCRPFVIFLTSTPRVDSPPDLFEEAHFNELQQELEVTNHFQSQLNFSTWSALRNDLERKLNQVYAEVWATLGSGEDERNYHKLITESPHKQAWLEALAKEGKSHQDLKTMSEPIEAKDLPPGARRSPSTLLVR